MKQSKYMHLQLQKATIKGFIFALHIVLNVLIEDYWPKADSKKLGVFVEKIVSLFDSVLSGSVDYDECVKYIYEKTGVTINVK